MLSLQLPLVQIEVVLQLHPHGYRMAVLGRGNESDLLRCRNCPLSQSVRQARHGADVRDCAPRAEDRPQNHCSGNLVLTRSFRVGRLWLIQHPRLARHVAPTENLAVVGAAATAAGTTAAFATRTAAGVTAFTRTKAATRARPDTATGACADTAPGTRTGRGYG